MAAAGAPKLLRVKAPSPLPVMRLPLRLSISARELPGFGINLVGRDP